MEKLPNVIRSTIIRKLKKVNWSINNFVEYINTEITSHESQKYINRNHSRQKVHITKFSGHFLISHGNQQSVYFTKIQATTLRVSKLNISVVFITHSYFAILKDITLNSTHFFVMKIPSKRELQQIAIDN